MPSVHELCATSKLVCALPRHTAPLRHPRSPRHNYNVIHRKRVFTPLGMTCDLAQAPRSAGSKKMVTMNPINTAMRAPRQRSEHLPIGTHHRDYGASTASSD